MGLLLFYQLIALLFRQERAAQAMDKLDGVTNELTNVRDEVRLLKSVQTRYNDNTERLEISLEKAKTERAHLERKAQVTVPWTNTIKINFLRIAHHLFATVFTDFGVRACAGIQVQVAGRGFRGSTSSLNRNSPFVSRGEACGFGEGGGCGARFRGSSKKIRSSGEGERRSRDGEKFARPGAEQAP